MENNFVSALDRELLRDVLSPRNRCLLEVLENAISPEIEEEYLAQWRDFTDGKLKQGYFEPMCRPIGNKKLPESIAMEHASVNKALDSFEAMLFSQLRPLWDILSGGNRFLSVRSNYGTPIIPSLFGAGLHLMPEESETLPASFPFHSEEKIEELVTRGIPDPREGLGYKVFTMGWIFREVFHDYPHIQKYVTCYHPDFQGPLDICEMIWGSDIFYAFYDAPELVHSLLSLVTDTYGVMMDLWNSIFSPPEYNIHWNMLMYRGGITLRNDSAMNLSPEMFNEFSVPYDKKLLQRFGGGVIHFCGRGDHFIEPMCRMNGVAGIQLSQPHLNNMEIIYQNTVDKGIPLLSLDAATARRDVGRKGGFSGLVSL